MQHDDKKALALIRLEHAEQCLKTAKAILGLKVLQIVLIIQFFMR